ncbi:MAG: CDP-diacylglycerol--glycerol-3-phosphate 3-phosphatidyltransferase [Alphaproteobacteria bacterium]
MLNLPNILTIARILILPLMFACFLLETSYGASAIWACFVLYVIASVTDFFDGWIARKYNLITAFGTFLDPISDKIFVGCLMVILVGFGRLEGVWLIPVLLIMFREFLVSGLREFLGPKNIQMPVTNLAKWKTASQMVALGFIILAPIVPLADIGGKALLCIAALLTLITGFSYMKAGWAHLKG